MTLILGVVAAQAAAGGGAPPAPGTTPAWDSVGTFAELISGIDDASTPATPARPATLAVGDLMVAVVLLSTTAAGPATSITIAMHANMSGDGWAEVAGSPFAFSVGARLEAALFWKIADASDVAAQGTAIPGGITGTHNGSETGDFLIAGIYRFTAADGFAADPFEDLNSATNFSNSVTMGSITPEDVNRLGVAINILTNNDRTIAAATGETGADWLEVNEVVGAGSLDYVFQLQTCDLSDGDPVTSGASAIDNNVNWASVTFGLVPADV